MWSKIFKNNFSILTICTVGGAFIKFLYSVLSKRFSLPEEYGFFAATGIIVTYMNFVQLGSLNAYNRDYPQLIGANDLQQAKKIKWATLTYLLCVYSAIFVVVSFALACAIFVFHKNALLMLFYWLVFLNALVTILNSFGTFSLKLEERFNYAGIVYLIQTLLSVLVGLWIIYKFGAIGLYIEPIICAAVGIILSYKLSFWGFKFNFDWNIIKSLLFSGIPLLINNIIWSFVETINRVVILCLMGTLALGYYSIALMAHTTIVLIPQTISSVFYVKLNKEYGIHHNIHKLISSAQKYTFICLICSGFVCLVSYYVLPFFVDYIMPKYVNGVKPAQIVITGACVYASTIIYGNIYTIIRENRQLLINSSCLCLINALMSICLVFILGKSLLSVAYGIVASYFFYSMLLICQLVKKTHQSWYPFLYTSILPVFTVVIVPMIMTCLSVQLIFSACISCIIWGAVVLICYQKNLRIFKN